VITGGVPMPTQYCFPILQARLYDSPRSRQTLFRKPEMFVGGHDRVEFKYSFIVRSLRSQANQRVRLTLDFKPAQPAVDKCQIGSPAAAQQRHLIDDCGGRILLLKDAFQSFSDVLV